jgi:hypothetical protein
MVSHRYSWGLREWEAGIPLFAYRSVSSVFLLIYLPLQVGTRRLKRYSGHGLTFNPAFGVTKMCILVVQEDPVED